MNLRSRFRSGILLSPLLLILLVPCGAARAVNLSPGDVPPPFTLRDLDGNDVSLADFRGRPVVIAFFSTWCSRCAEELEFLRDAFPGGDVAPGNAPPAGAAVLLVNQDGEGRVSPRQVGEFRDRLSLNFPLFLDRGLVLWELFGISSLPTTVVVGGDGRVLLVESGFNREARERLRGVFLKMGPLGEIGGTAAGKCASAGHITSGGERGRP